MSKLFFQIRALTVFYMIVLVVSGITAFPLYSELKFIIDAGLFKSHPLIEDWLIKVFTGVKEINEKYPFLFYGFDWLAFAHLVIAILFIGVYQHPVRNRWIIQWAIITCIAILPFAFIAGSIRDIPFFHVLVDCSFGVIGLIPLYIIQTKINELKKYRVKIKSDNK